jgi:hypothetical protein
MPSSPPASSPTTRTGAAATGPRAAVRLQGLSPRGRAPAVPTRAAPRPAAATAAAEPPLPRWAKRFVIGGLLLAIAMPLTVLMSRSMLVQTALTDELNLKAAMVCTAGEGRALDGSSLLGWLFGGSYFQCGDWETREGRIQRDREQAEANYLAREKTRREARY